MSSSEVIKSSATPGQLSVLHGRIMKETEGWDKGTDGNRGGRSRKRRKNREQEENRRKKEERFLVVHDKEYEIRDISSSGFFFDKTHIV